MSNYSLVINSRFKPFSYQELVAPIAHQQQVFDRLADEYDKLSSQADVLEAMGKNDKDSKVYAKYKAYSDNLRAEAENLYRNGLDTESRMRLTDLRRMYNTDIVPIQNAWNKRDQEAQMQMKARMDAAARGVDIRFSRDAANSSLESYINNPNQSFKVINGNQIATETSNIFKGLASQLKQDKNGNYWIGEKMLSPIESRIITQRGMDFNEYSDFVNNPNDPQFASLKGIIDNVLKAHSAQDFDPDTQRAMFQYGVMGASAGVGATDMQYHIDPYKKALFDYGLDMNKERQKLAMANAQAAKADDESLLATSEYELPMMGADFSNSEEQEDAMKTLGYVMDNGKLRYTNKVRIGNSEASVFGKDGKVMTRRQFVSQAGNDKSKQKAYGEYFDKMVDAGKTLGVYGTLYTRGELNNKYNALRDSSAAKFAKVYALNYEGSDWNPNSKNYVVREIKGYKKGEPVYDTERITLNDLLNRKDSNKNALNVSAYWSRAKGQEGLILATSEDGEAHRYFIGADQMPENNIRLAKKYFNDSDEYLKKGDEANAIKAREIALGLLHTGLTIHNSAFEQKQVRQKSLTQQGLTKGE